MPLAIAPFATAELATQTLALPDPDCAFARSDIVVAGAELGDGYGLRNAAKFEAARLVTRSEGLFSIRSMAKTFGNVIFANGDGAWRSEETALPLMTGGLPSLFA